MLLRLRVAGAELVGETGAQAFGQKLRRPGSIGSLVERLREVVLAGLIPIVKLRCVLAIRRGHAPVDPRDERDRLAGMHLDVAFWLHESDLGAGDARWREEWKERVQHRREERQRAEDEEDEQAKHRDCM